MSTAFFSEWRHKNNLNLIYFLVTYIFQILWCAYIYMYRWRKDSHNLPISIHYLRKCRPSWHTHPLTPSMSYFSFPQWLQHWLSFLFNYNSFLATPTSSIMTHLWIWLHFNFLKCNVLHLYFIYSTFSTVIPTTWSSLKLFPRFLI